MPNHTHSPSDRAKTAAAIIIVLGSTLLSTFYGLISYQVGNEADPNRAFTAFTNGLILSILLSCLGILFDLTYSLNAVRGAATSLTTSPDLKRVLTTLQDTRNKILTVERRLSGDHQSSDRVKKIADFTGVVRETAERSFNDYLNNFVLLDDGFRVEGEDWSLRSYYFFWECLLEEQVKKKDDDENLIVRITHSNSIRIWLNENPDVSKLLKLQKSFREAGGRIVRVFLGDETQAGGDYEKVLTRMRDSGMDAFYLKPEANTLPYDFLWVNELDFVVKWYSGAGGRTLGSCEILKVQDTVARELRSRWDNIWRQVVENRALLQPYFTPEVETLYKSD